MRLFSSICNQMRYTHHSPFSWSCQAVTTAHNLFLFVWGVATVPLCYNAVTYSESNSTVRGRTGLEVKLWRLFLFCSGTQLT